MAKRRKVSNPLALAVLAELTIEPMHPYEMGRRLKEQGKDRNIKYNRSSLYMVVEQLRKAGFVAEQETVRDTQRPERTVYALTEEGRTELDDWMCELVAEPQYEYPAFGVALCLLAALPVEESADLLGRRLEALDERIDATRAQLHKVAGMDIHPMFVIEDDYALALLEAERRYTENLIGQLRDPEFGRTLEEYLGRME
ncbi:PadR family transcriptional regulator [Kitasatospora sp. NPDC057542]|uniref:PadR family transcriptional regulator n=1 Tax=Streptomycetaceae TaxID=2062 RepID=UPI001CCCFB83|nr:PadR family transcriptional regulator [Streptomyces sp. LS1784]